MPSSNELWGAKHHLSKSQINNWFLHSRRGQSDSSFRSVDEVRRHSSLGSFPFRQKAARNGSASIYVNVWMKRRRSRTHSAAATPMPRQSNHNIMDEIGEMDLGDGFKSAFRGSEMENT